MPLKIIFPSLDDLDPNCISCLQSSLFFAQWLSVIIKHRISSSLYKQVLEQFSDSPRFSVIFFPLTRYTIETCFQIVVDAFVTGTPLPQMLIVHSDAAFRSSRTLPIHELQDVGRTSEIIRIQLQICQFVYSHL